MKKIRKMAWRSAWMWGVLLVIVLMGVAWRQLQQPQNWQFYTAASVGPNSNQSVYSTLTLGDQLVIFNTQDGVTHALKQTNGQLAWEFRAQRYSPFPAVISENRVFLANFDGTISALELDSGDQLWRFLIPDQMLPDTPPVISDDGWLVFFATRGGTLYALDAGTGEVRWTHQFAVPDTTGAFEENTIHFGQVFAHGDQVFAFNAPENSFAAFDLTSGKEVWRVTGVNFRFTHPIFTPQFVVLPQNDALRVIRLADGTQATLPRQNSDGPWQAITPQADDDSLLVIDNQTLTRFDLAPTTRSVWSMEGVTVSWATPQFSSAHTSLPLYENAVLAQRYSGLNGTNTVTAVDVSTGGKIWENTLPINIVEHEYSLEESLVLGEKTGHVIALDRRTGQLEWQTKLSGEILALAPSGNTLAVVAADASRKHAFFLLDPHNKGAILWRYVPDILLSADQILLQSSGAYFLDEQRNVIEKILLTPENPEKHLPKKLNFTAEQKTNRHEPFLELTPKTPFLWKIAAGWQRLRFIVTHLADVRRFDVREENADGVAEFTLTHNQALYENTDTALDIRARFTHLPTGKTTEVRGYYFDADTWKVRFRPTESGKYTWQLSIVTPLTRTTYHGKSELTTDGRLPLTVNGDAFQIGNTAFFPLGLQNSFTDFNFDGSVTNQLRGSDLLRPTENQAEFRFISLDEYLDTYTQEAGINFFRYGVDNFAPSLYQSLSPDAIRWDVLGGQFGDSLLAALRKRDVRVMMTIFGFHPPFDSKEEMRNSSHRRALTTYLDYVIARFGADVDIWEIGNEARSDQEWYDFVLSYLKTHDPYQHPVSTNWELLDEEKTDFASLHWYNEDTAAPKALNDSLLFIKTGVAGYHKPIILSEFGFKNVSWFPSSATSVRVFSWSAAFQKMGLVFWNQGQNGIFRNPSNANVYLGPVERAGLLTLQKFLPSMEMPVTTESLSVPDSNIRIALLSNNKYLLGYLLKTAPGKAGAQLPLPLAGSARVEWIIPATGEALSDTVLAAGSHLLAIPEFEIDLALRITYEE